MSTKRERTFHRLPMRAPVDMIADGITLSRMVFSLLLLAFPTCSAPFMIFYLLCGISDVLDGFAARRLHTESERGAMLDSAADLLFAFVYALRVLPCLSLPKWVWGWTALIASVKAAGILLAGRKGHGLRIAHSRGNKLTGLLLFLFPLSAYIADIRLGAIFAGAAATVTAVGELVNSGERKKGEAASVENVGKCIDLFPDEEETIRLRNGECRLGNKTRR